MLKSWKCYQYINQSGCPSINGVDDSKKFDGLRLALNVLQVSNEDTESIFSVIAGILWLGNLRFAVFFVLNFQTVFFDTGEDLNECFP